MSALTVTQLAVELQSLIDAGKGDLPVILHAVRFTDGDIDDVPVSAACVLPYNSREQPERVLID